MSETSEQDRLFAAVLIEGTEDATEAWLAFGPEGVSRLRDELSGVAPVSVPSEMSSKEIIDNLAWASRLIASAYPDEFLTAFDGAEWDDNSFVCAGLGGIQRPIATKRLMRLLGHDDKWIRVQAAVSLRGHRHRGLRSVLLAAADDPDYLVRYHVAEALAGLGE